MKKLVETRLPSVAGNFQMMAFGEEGELHPHLVLVSNNPQGGQGAVLVRIHSECMTGDVFGSQRCDCGDQLNRALARIGNEGGCLIYLRQEGRGIGLVEKMKAYNLQDEGLDTIAANEALGHESDSRVYDAANQILRELGFERIRLLTNNPSKVEALKSLGIEVVERVPLVVDAIPENEGYLAIKKTLMGHWLD